ncbi:Two-component hybrid sensor and regulator [Labilithrix luteola]|uniref:histidine kinase n=1 Tax=Labilithrix luteola TaxID=1391654 RepID=A0A0K1PMK2_9BACT|nr:Two-component hybrid sensor and regulator [Labilithrix luteola]
MRSVVGEKRELLDAIFERTTYGVMACDSTGQVVSMNRAAEHLWAGGEHDRARTGHSSQDFTVLDDLGRGRPFTEWALEHGRATSDPLRGPGVGTAVKLDIRRRDGTLSTLLAHSAPMHEVDGSLAGALCVFAEVAPWKETVETTQAAHRRASFLVQAGTKLLSTSLDPDETLRQLVQLTVPAVADSCHVYLIEEGTERLRLVAGAWAQTSAGKKGEALDQRFPVELEERTGVARVIRTGKAELRTCVTDEDLRLHARNAEHLELIRAIGFKAAILAPLIARNRVIGAISLTLLTQTDGPRNFEAADLDMTEQLAVSAGLAVENARLYQYEQNARAAIERAANRMHRLQAIMTDLASTLTYDDVAKAVIDHGVAAIGADFGAIWLADDAPIELTLLRQHQVAPEKLGRVVSLDEHAPITDCFRRREPVFAGTHAEFSRTYPRCASSFENIMSFACLPLNVQGKTTGVLAFAFNDARDFDADERAFLLLVGEHCAQGFYRARMYEAEQRARTEMALLYSLVDAVNRATSLPEVYEPALDIVQRALDVSRSSILLFDGDGVIRFKSWRGLSDEYRTAVTGHSPWSRDTTDPTPVFITDVETDPSAAPYREIFRREAVGALGFFPLVHHGKLLGKFMVYSHEPRVFTDDEVRLARTIAAQISEAIARKVSEAEAETARASAEYASRMKDEFLAVVSHELRTPLSSIMGWASILQTERRNDAAVLAKGLEVIERNAKAQTTIIEDILDVSRIIRGKLHLDAHPTTLVPLVVETIESLKTSARAKDIRVRLDALDVEDDQFLMVGDPERLRQIAWNLISNAIKFTPPGGKVTVRLRRALGAIVLEVEDTGMGIDIDFLPFVFDRFRQADSTTTRRQGGLGLGLSIVRHLVELHGGQVSVKSEGRGNGSTFVVQFPVRAIADVIPTDAPTDVPTERTTVRQSFAPRPLDAGDGSELPELFGVRILVVDDQPDARDMLKEALASYGAVVEVASSASEAVRILQSFEPKVLVTDIGMPDEDGYALLKRIRSLPGRLAKVPAIAVTAYARAEDARRARSAGFQSHVTKPTRPDTLAKAVVRALPIAYVDSPT